MFSEECKKSVPTTATPTTSSQPCPKCANGGKVVGTVADKNCGCSCPLGFSGQTCEGVIPCPNCENGGKIVGTVADNNCGCSCANGFTGKACEDVAATSAKATGDMFVGMCVW